MRHAADHAAIDRAVDLLREGRLVAFPTETVYGLGADAMNPAAVRAVYRLKGRPSTNPLIVHVADAHAAEEVSRDWSGDAAVLAERFWPGPLTMVLSKGGGLPDEVVAGGDTVALRCPDHPVALALLRAFGGPLVGPSANPSGRVSPTTAAHVREAFEESDVFVLDGGPCRVGIESTVVSLVGQRARVLRAGVISAADIADALGKEIDDDAEGRDRSDARAIASPGRFASHYAPRAPAALLGREAMVSELDRARISGEHRFVAIVLAPVDIESVDGLSEILMPMEAGAYAQRLYAALHEADERAPVRILIEEPSFSGPLWDAIRDRLRRACAPSA
jgi:L-threonylcarbamoyladenylate synthase